MYDLYAQIVHHPSGTSRLYETNSGHYTAFLRTTAGWVHANDSAVSMLDGQPQHSRPYVVFYVKRQIVQMSGFATTHRPNMPPPPANPAAHNITPELWIDFDALRSLQGDICFDPARLLACALREDSCVDGTAVPTPPKELENIALLPLLRWAVDEYRKSLTHRCGVSASASWPSQRNARNLVEGQHADVVVGKKIQESFRFESLCN